MPLHRRNDFARRIGRDNAMGFQARFGDFLSNSLRRHAGGLEVDGITLLVFEVIHDDRNLGAKRSSIEVRVKQSRLRIVGIGKTRQGQEEDDRMEVFHKNFSTITPTPLLANHFS